MNKMGLIFDFDTFLETHIDALIKQIIDANIGIELNWDGQKISDHPYTKIRRNFENYSNFCKKNVKTGKIDRHKIAASICGAVASSKPLKCDGRMGSYINEKIALYTGMLALKEYMIEDVFGTSNVQGRSYVSYNYEMSFYPVEENIKDKNTYFSNIVYNLKIPWQCEENITKQCIKFDVLAYATIFFTLEKYNQKNFTSFCSPYI